MSQTIQNLGELDAQQPVLIFGGPYSNLAATQALQQVAQRLNLPPEQVICTGDIVAYCADAAATTRLIRQWGIPVVMGNCEQSLAEGALDCGCGFDAGSACSLLSTGWYSYARKQVSSDDCRWMGTLPSGIGFSLLGRRFQLVHGGIKQINRFVFAGSEAEVFAEEAGYTDADIIIGGHCGIPFARTFAAARAGDKSCATGKNRHWLNAGVIGMPANDGTADGWYLLLTANAEADRICASWHRLSYPVADSQQAMTAAGLNTPYREALATGLWPSVDILPETERSACGQPLTLTDYWL